MNKTHDEACFDFAVSEAAYYSDHSNDLAWQWIRVAEMYRGKIKNERVQ